MIIRSRGGNREVRAFAEWQNTVPRHGSGLVTHSGTSVTPATAIGLPAVNAAIRLVAETIAGLSLVVYRGQKADKRVAEDAWQFGLLHENPCSNECSVFDFLSDLAAAVEAAGNYYAQKVKSLVRSDRRLLALRPLNPWTISAERDRDSDEKVFRVWTGAKVETFSPSEILHVRGPSIDPRAVMGLSPIYVHRHKLGWAMALDEAEGRWFANGASPGGALRVPGRVTEPQAREMQALWVSEHGGLDNMHKPAIIHSGAEWVSIGVSAEDAQFVESQKLSVEQVARIFRVPPELLGAGSEERTAEQSSLRFLVFSLQPRLRRIESGLKNDPDLFPTTDPYPEFDVSGLVRTDAKTKAEVQHFQIQDGTKLVDEIRAENGDAPLPPVPEDPSKEPGKVPQITPVGGAPSLPMPTSPNGAGE